jgi:hypothetical protein
VLLLKAADPVGEALVLAVHCPQFCQDEPYGAVEAHDHRGQHLRVVAHPAHFGGQPLLLAGEKFEVIGSSAMAKRLEHFRAN